VTLGTTTTTKTTTTTTAAGAPIAPTTVRRAYAACEALARSHYENFPVASRLLPAAMRPPVAAVYAFARVADDMADEGEMPASQRLERLATWERRLHEALEHGSASTANVDRGDRDDLIIVAAAHTIRQLDLPVSLFDDLISAFGQDTMTNRYDSWAALFDYCRRSANPVGRLVLRIAGHRDERLDRSSDAFCTALQLTNFWQDFGRDWKAGRVYVPREVYARFGATEDQLRTGDVDQAWTRAMDECVRVTRDLFQQGRAVCDGVAGRLRYELRLTWLGGRLVLDRVEGRGARMLTERPTLGIADLPMMVARAAGWS
jgi:phytoene synthase